MMRELISLKECILALYQLEEVRPLVQAEFSMRQWCYEKAYCLATSIETQWQQRSRRQWLAEGDNNTKFFHSYASLGLRTNTVQTLLVVEQLIMDAGQICSLFHNYMCQILGTEVPVVDFDTTTLYEDGLDLRALQNPFFEQEIEATVFNLANNHASRSDGLPSEFAKTYWAEIKHDIFILLQDFYHENIDLSPLNTANIVMILKKSAAIKLKDFQPISILSLISKIISKLLATRLSGYLSQLISINQSAFIRGRQISENFLVVREILHHESHTHQLVVFLRYIL